MKVSEEEKILLKSVVEHFYQEDRPTRERQIRSWRRLKLLWDGFSRTWYSEVAHDWRIYDESSNSGDSQQNAYDKPVNVFRAYLESIIAALSISIPSIKCYPDDADNPLDLMTARAGDKIGELVSRHNDVSLLWIHALFIYCTEGMVAAYNYTKEDDSYGKYDKPNYEDKEEEHNIKTCPNCNSTISEDLSIEGEPPNEDIKEDEYDPNIHGELCPECDQTVNPVNTKLTVTVTRLVGTTSEAKTRQCIEAYGGTYVKVANYAKCQADTPYLIFSYETNYTFAREWYPELRDKIGPGIGGANEFYERWGRNSPQYAGNYPLDSVTVRNSWLRPCAFEYLDEDNCKKMKKRFPNGAKVVLINDVFAEACDESLDDHWTLTHNPLSDHIYFDPIGLLLTSIQEITNDLVSLTLQTIEHGIPQTFADSSVISLKAYSQMEATPGAIYAATPRTGKSMSDAFYEVKTASLSAEVLPFYGQVQEMGQLVSGALPSLFGGNTQGGSGTASEYSMSRAQAQQRLQNTWKMLIVWWKTIYGKVIPAYIKTVQEQGDERVVKKDDFGGFVNILIRKAEIEGKLGSIEIEANENLPMSWSQRRDVIMKLVESNNPEVLSLIAQPENLPLLYEALGINDLYIPGEDDREKQYSEIKELLNSTPIPQPPTPEDEMMAMQTGEPPQEIEEPSVEADTELDNNEIEFEICRKWAISEAGRLAKIENPDGYRNVLLHAMQHKLAILPPPMAPDGSSGAAPLSKPKQNKNAPITGEKDVQLQA